MAEPLARSARPRHVLHVSMPTSAGVPSVALSYVRDQVARGWTVDVVCPRDGWLGELAHAAGARVVAWPARRAPGTGMAGETRRLAAIIARQRPDVLHLHSAKAGVAGRLAVHGHVPTVFQPHGWSFLAVRGVAAEMAARWERFAVRWTDALVLVSEAERVLGRARGIAGPARVVPNGVDCTALAAAGTAERAAARQALGLGSGPVAVCIGRLSRQKGQRDLFAAWSAVRSRVPDATLVLVGEGPDRADLETRAGDGVRLAGERSDVPLWLAAATVVVAPSRWEGMALAPLEALARGRAVVATDVAGMVEAVPPGAGAVVGVGDRAALIREIADRLADPAGADLEGLRGRAHVEANHDGARSAAAIVSVYESILAARR